MKKKINNVKHNSLYMNIILSKHTFKGILSLSFIIDNMEFKTRASGREPYQINMLLLHS